MNLILFSVCDLMVWPWLLLWWLLPFLLGLLLGWLLWSGYKKRLEEAQLEIENLKLKLGNVQSELEACMKRRKILEEDLLVTRGQIKEMQSLVDAKSVVHTKPSGAKTSMYSGLTEDMLQVVEGIGPKMEKVLNENGITTWSVLADRSAKDLRNLLDGFGARYKIIDPVTWPEQAGLARDGKWEDLIQRQKELSGGSLEVAGETDSKVEKMLIKLGLIKKYQKDDLKAIEGVGPKIEKLLHKAGIDTWVGLSKSSVATLQKILADAGDRYRLADPSTWPKQAEYAANGQWKEFEEYQDYLQGGREV